MAENFSVGFSFKVPMKLHSDSGSTQLIATNPIFNECIQYLEVDVHFVKEKMKALLGIS